MRWFKHMTESHSDEKLAQLLALHGAEGYGFWWLLVETVAHQTGKDDNKCSVTYPASYWMRITGFYHFKKLKMLVESLHNLSLISAQCSSNLSTISALSPKDVLTISMPNILKYRDEYSKKSVHKTESVGAKREIEKQKEIKKEPLKAFAPPTVFEVKGYMDEIEYRGSPQKFVDHYTSNGWKVGPNKMKCWKAAVRTWRGKDNERTSGHAGSAGNTGKKTGFIEANGPGTNFMD